MTQKYSDLSKLNTHIYKYSYKYDLLLKILKEIDKSEKTSIVR